MDFDEIYQDIQAFLQNPESKDHAGAFWDSCALIWVDWRDDDESVVEHISESLPPEVRIEYEVRDCTAPRGVDIFIKNGRALETAGSCVWNRDCFPAFPPHRSQQPDV